MVKISYDSESDILYIEISDRQEYDVLEAEDAEILVDEDGKPIAIEIWNANKNGLKEILHKK